MTEEEKEEQEEIQKDMVRDVKRMYKCADQNNDGCLDKSEYYGMGDQECPEEENTEKKAPEEEKSEDGGVVEDVVDSISDVFEPAEFRKKMKARREALRSQLLAHKPPW